jgi:hypothetical protein
MHQFERDKNDRNGRYMREYFMLNVHTIMFSTVPPGIYPIKIRVEQSTKYMLNILMGIPVSLARMCYTIF